MYETQAEIDAFFKCLFQLRPLRVLGNSPLGSMILIYDEVERRNKVITLLKDLRAIEAVTSQRAVVPILMHLVNPYIIRLCHVGRVALQWDGVRRGRYYLLMEFGGSSLRPKLGEYRVELDEDSNRRYHGGGRRLPIEEALRISIGVCEGLEALHGIRGAPFRMIHRNIMPDNIFIDDQTGIARVGGLDLCVFAPRSCLASFAETVIYMAPECFKGHASFQSDLYSLGIVMYEILTGELPFHNFEERLEGPPQPPRKLVPEIPTKLSDCILRTLEAKPESRQASAGELLTNLRRLRPRMTMTKSDRQYR